MWNIRIDEREKKIYKENTEQKNECANQNMWD